jgi:DNA-binding IclR family transcriptional regulator
MRDRPHRPLVKTEESVMAFLRREREPKTAQEVGYALGIRPSRASHVLSAMAKAGQVKKVSRGTYQSVEAA